ncbi:MULTISPECIES: (deoxy)nucleoside triphosphate pyrophosphohydrolase [unclassified Pseudodesulfovibrio]|uniref:(deoxy)nucleoside triphosphate pyrophosphohydrolase n=1 Tax=unclassified Pseudodesulfovibrio TaxID=2661612 RepID=UPI000FEBD30B|nr:MULTISPECIES: (deoxy)nucleoside triphosphate pyrophosphohydrolase [unclassified Pseudodesulfovibrio]MCJ2164078.1 (deoxy)nucleoside triphosphate pyrophosphohydrolase [Pseudodesulfovibrio sp. S3-i]RWU05291.1 (deoxy)nucleoside triphosphate pyrophosphohydrolase [Pseudodesulfovibrio sp. S3]
MKPVLNVVAGIIWRGTEYLAVERPEGARMAGWWEFPGGKIEAGESRDQALVREFQEELGITPTEFEYWRDLEHEYDEFVVRLSFFHVRKYSGQLLGLENQRMAWVDPAQPPSLRYLPADIAIVEALHR